MTVIRKLPNSMPWYVIGGVYTDGTFTALESAGECYGPYATTEEAHIAAKDIMRRNIDICWHKLWVVRVS